MAPERGTARETEEKQLMAKVRTLMMTDEWDALMRLVNRRVVNLSREPVTGRDAFETLRALHTREGRIDGLLKFFDDLDNGASSQ